MAFQEDFAEICKTFMRNYAAKDAAACATVYTDDAEFMNSGASVAKGRKAIEEGFRAALESGAKIQDLQFLWIDSSGDIGCVIQKVVGSPEFTIMLALRRFADGKWKVTREVVVAS
jgi:ketosteroid isomerase-like protein